MTLNCNGELISLRKHFFLPRNVLSVQALSFTLINNASELIIHPVK